MYVNMRQFDSKSLQVKGKIIFLFTTILSEMEEESERFHFFPDTVYDSVAYDPGKTRLSQSEAEAEKPTNYKARNRAL